MLYYTPPEPVRRPFKSGEVVEVCDRDLEPMSQVKIKRAGKQVIRLVDGRRFRAFDGWYMGSNGTWPFPSIRHLET